MTGTFQNELRGSAVVRPGFVAYELFPAFDPAGSTPGAFPYEGTAFEQRLWEANALRTISGILTNADLNDPMLVLAGQKYTLPQTGQLLEFALYTDPRQSLSFPVTIDDEDFTIQNFVAPFATLEGSPLILGDGANVQVSTLKVLEKDGSVANSRGVWLQTSFYIGDNGQQESADLYNGSQESLVVVALGGAGDSTGLTGERRGGAALNAISLPNSGPNTSSHEFYNPLLTTQEHIAFTGDISTIPGADGAHFLGTGTPNIVVGTDTTNGNDAFRDTPLTNNPDDGFLSATYHVGTGGTPQAAPEQTSGTFLGYAAGIARTVGGEDEGAMLVSNGPDDVKIVFDATSNTLSATMITHVVDNDGVQYPECGGECDRSSSTLRTIHRTRTKAA